MRRNYWVVVASVVVIALLAGCRDTAVAPSAAPSSAPASQMLAPVGHPSLSLSGKNKKNGSADFTISPWGGVYVVGNHAVVFPAHSVCDPDKSSYGPGTWDAPCEAMTKPMRVHAKVRTVNGESSVDFSPEIRFVPAANPARWVWIFMYTPEAIGAQDVSRFNILFTQSLGATPENDAASDKTLRTYVDTRSGLSFRRIKHFSGYIVSSGFACEDACGMPTDGGQ